MTVKSLSELNRILANKAEESARAKDRAATRQSTDSGRKRPIGMDVVVSLGRVLSRG